MGKTVTTIASIAATASGNPWLTAAMTAYSMTQEKRAAKKSAKAEQGRAAAMQRAEDIKQKANEARAKEAMVAQRRKARIAQGKVAATGQGIMGGGTSAFSGAIGSIGSQAANNIGNVQQEQGFSNSISGYNQQAADATAQGMQARASQTGWQQVQQKRAYIIHSCILCNECCSPNKRAQ